MKPLATLSLQESRQILALAVPILIAELSQAAMGFIDTLMAARYGAEDLAAVALGSGIWLPVLISLGGLLMAITPMVANHAGSDQLRRTRLIFHQGVLIALFAGAFAWLILRNMEVVLDLMQVTGSLKIKTLGYLDALSWGIPGMMLYQGARSYSEGLGKTQPLMKIALFALLCNIPLNYLLIYGKLGFPELGGVGCGWATTIVMWIMALSSGCYLRYSRHFRSLYLITLPRPRANYLLTILRIGIPIGFTLLIEVSMFTVIALLIARLGEIVIAAHQITLSFTGMVFMIPLSIAMALTIRIGQFNGRKDPLSAAITARNGYALVCCSSVISCTLIALLSMQIAAMYSDNSDIIQLASSLLLIAAIFQIPDAIQVASAGILRGHKDTAVPLMIVFTAYWLIGLPLGYLLGLTDLIVPATGARGFWLGMIAGLSVGAILLLLRYQTIKPRCKRPTGS
ncbi:multidrug resistance protein, MATE family [Amphritea atlantica]|uniref:Multidrug-efflux transporter n=1 Tax=Amphritea atlantica TaxID=355243 RepID=A0A1H9FJW0_9GAMM|nr:MATE family efflux transporter [Amphritea atlantica]SEQ38197.1 multidrug resistance protein, MATE family [Amphritea atlantica]